MQPNARETRVADGSVDTSHAGTAMPDFRFADPAGKVLELKALRGTPVLLNLWATWCAPCVTEMPLLDQLAAQMKGKLRVLTVSQDMEGDKTVAPFFAARKFAHLEPWLDPESELAFHFGGANLPMNVLYDASGREVWRLAGDFDWTSTEATRLIDQAVPDPG